MTVLFNIAWKDLTHMLRDRTSLVLNLAAPLLLTMVIGFALGGFGSVSGGFVTVPVVIANLDAGAQGEQLVHILTPSDADVQANHNLQQIRNLIAPTLAVTDIEARSLVDQDKVGAAIIIPTNFSESLTSGNRDISSLVTIYANPNQTLGASVVRTVTQSVIDQMVIGSVAGQLGMQSLISSGRLQPSQAASQGQVLLQPFIQRVLASQPISFNVQVEGAKSSGGGFNWLDYMAPSMAVMYLMFTMSQAARTILQEKQMGTLPRMLISPTSRASVLGGKMLGVFFIGLAQMAVLILAGNLLFNVHYGSALPLIVFTLALVAAASAWGILEASFARTTGQANQLGWIVNLSFAALAGNFVPRVSYPDWMQKLSLVTPNAWGIDTYSQLIRGASLTSILPAVVALTGMAAVLFLTAVLIFRKRFA